MMDDDDEGLTDDAAFFDLVMPFVVTKSHGGPYEDQAFCAGWELGLLDTILMPSNHGLSTVMQIRTTIRTTSLPQVDLMAMKHGWVFAVAAEKDPDDVVEGWTTVFFRRPEDRP